MYFTLQDGTAKGKRYKAIFYDEDGNKIKTTQFGSSFHENFTIHRDKQRRELYRKRHHKDKIDEPYSAGALSWWILWNKPTLEASIKDYARRFKIKYIEQEKTK
jgi:hypothetical protein